MADSGTSANRKRPSKMSSSSAPRADKPPMSIVPSRRNSPYLPIPLEAAILSLYPILLIFGSAFALLSPQTRSAPFDRLSHAHDPALAPSYFARKDNLFNVLFVKRGWAWITVAFAFFLATTDPSGSSRQQHNPKQRGGQVEITPGGRPNARLRAGFRWLLVTGWWFLVTQWCFGPPLIDRGFRFTGGKCEEVEAKVDAQGGRGPLSSSTPAEIFSAAACRSVGGTWQGGHDISGHVFLLVLGSFFLAQEVGWVVYRARIRLAAARQPREKDPRAVVMHDGAVKSIEVEAERLDDGGAGAGDFDAVGLGGKFAVGVVVLSFWMLLMTAIYFHTWFEKLTGLLVAFISLYSVYILPRWIPSLRHVIGLPGI